MVEWHEISVGSSNITFWHLEFFPSLYCSRHCAFNVDPGAAYETDPDDNVW